MITRTEFEILDLIVNGESDKIKNFDAFDNLVASNKIAFMGNKGAYLTPSGESAYEEYEHFLQKVARENRTLSLAEEANKKSKNANIISAVSIVISIVSIILSIFVL